MSDSGEATGSTQVTRFVDELDQRKSQIRLRLPAHIDAERFSAIITTAVSRNPALARADRRSFWNAAMLAASDGLHPDGREGAFVIFRTKEDERWVEKVQWLPMVEGIRLKARNSGEILAWDSYVVHEKDEFEYELGDEPFIHHKPWLDGDPGQVIAAYSICKFKNGEVSREVMSRAEIEKVRTISRAANKGPWVDWYEEMARKTVVHRHSKSIPLSSDLADVIHRDDTPIEAAPEDEPKPKIRRRMSQEDRLKTLAGVNPVTGEIPTPEEEVAGPEASPEPEAGPQTAPAPSEPQAATEPSRAGQRGPKGARKPSEVERLQKEGDAAAAKGADAYQQWRESLTADDLPNVSLAMERHWKEALAKNETP